jgi:hypothetical protein
MTRVLLIVAVLLTGLTGCAHNLNFRTDHRLHWVGPPARKLVNVPFMLAWQFDGSHPAEFAVFVDRAPVKPGQSLKAVAGSDTACKSDPTCPDASYLANRQVYTTTGTTLALSQVNPLNSDREGTQLHQATVVLLDQSGRRIGESAWTREFKLRRVSNT